MVARGEPSLVLRVVSIAAVLAAILAAVVLNGLVAP